LIISPHGRGLSGEANAAIWGDLPARGLFAVVNPDSQGRRLARYSWGYAGHVDDLARMPRIVERALPWLRIDRTRIFAFGGSMGGQETLLLLARHPRLLAGAAAFDSVTDFALQYSRFPLLTCRGVCRRAWREPIGTGLQKLAQLEVGGPPETARRAYAARSPLTYASRIAASCVPLQLWWSVADRVVVDQARQSARLFWELRRLNRGAPVEAYVGFWIHSSEMQARTRLPLALASFGLLPEIISGDGLRWVPQASSAPCDGPG
jgi:dipeptidyl aminopeptidase/acylaminoacyl peptidase